MLFNSWSYLVFMGTAVPLHWLLPHRGRISLLGILSILFYALWRWEFASIMIFSAWIDFFCSRHISRTSDKRTRFGWLLVSLIVNFGMLGIFKYAYFVHEQIQWLAWLGGHPLPSLRDLGVHIILPLGISFYTFQTVSYTIDVYRGTVKPVKDFFTFLTFVTFWPQLVAGPILRIDEVVPQLERERYFSWKDFNWGLYRILIGLFKKVVLADNIAPMVDKAFALNPAHLSALDTWVAAFLFGFQIYFDFAGYSDIGLGSARMLGFDFPENFHWPYLATSPRGFWQRWHISLSSWIRDYLYLPLSGERFRSRTANKIRSQDGLAVASEPAKKKRLGALLLTWFIMGLWHGAAWRFAVWGIYHALLIYGYRVSATLQRLVRRWPAAAWALMLALVTAGWVPFRAQSISQMLTLTGKLLNPWAYRFQVSILDREWYACAFVMLAGMLGLRGLMWLYQRFAVLKTSFSWVHVLALTGLTFLVIVYLRPARPFIYFQF